MLGYFPDLGAGQQLRCQQKGSYWLPESLPADRAAWDVTLNAVFPCPLLCRGPEEGGVLANHLLRFVGCGPELRV